MNLPPELSALTNYNQFVLWKLTPDGKKLPIAAHTGAACNPHDTANQLNEADAFAAADFLGVNVGYVFTARDNIFFLDIDHALRPDGTWSQLAQDLCAAAVGCAIEVSQSGTGLHIFGTYSTLHAHCNKNAALGIELYVTERFVALTCRNVSGVLKLGGEAQAFYESLLAYFPPRAKVAAAAWTDQPDPEWRGPDEDAELLRRILDHSDRTFPGDKATFRQLWEGADELGHFYSHDTNPFDHSSADAALCSKLAFWTGKNSARMDRMLRASALYRDKWERPDYREATVAFAISGCNKVYIDPKLATPAELQGVATPAPSGDGPAMVSDYQMLAADQQRVYFAGCYYIKGIHRIFMPGGTVLTPAQFKASMGGRVFALDAVNRATTRNAFEAFTESQVIRWPQADELCFRPDKPPGVLIDHEGLKYLNTYIPVPVASIAGDVGPFLGLLGKQFPNERDYRIVLAYSAFVVQYPGVKAQWAPVIQGAPGNGKSFIGAVISRAVGERYTATPNAQELTSRFNGWVEGILFAVIEEACAKPGTAEALKPLITNARVEIQSKGIDQRTGDNRGNYMLFSNFKDGVIKLRDDRRYCVFFTPQQSAEDIERDMPGQYFPELYRWLEKKGGGAHTTHFLRNYAIPDELNPAVQCHRAPYTSSTPEALVTSRGTFEQEIAEAIEEGRPRFCNGWVSSCAISDLIDEKLRNERIPRNRWRGLMGNLNYVVHPGIPNGRCSTALQLEGMRKPTFYILREHRDIGLRGAQVHEAYLRAQGSAFGT